MKRIFFLIALLFSFQVLAQTSDSCAVETVISGAIGPATLDLFQRTKARAESHKCSSVLLLINTPGGSLQTTRLIVEEIISSPVPVLCLVHPSGGHAGSAGAIIMLACHLSGAVQATNIGAATPIMATGEKISEDLRNKMINDTVSWVEGLAKLRGRSEQYARDIVKEAKAVSAEEALKLNAIEFAGATKEEFIKFAQGRKIKLNDTLDATVGFSEIKKFEPDLRYKFMALLMDPQVAYLIFMGSLGLLYYELTHPGLIVPGVVGAVGLTISLVSLHMLDVTWGAVILILLGIGFMIAEAFVAGFGILGLGGIVSFFVGSLFLFDPETTGYALPLSTILPTTIALGLTMLGIAYLAFRSRGVRRRGGFDDLIGRQGKITEVKPGDGKFGFMEIDGELWRFAADRAMEVGDVVLVKEHKGLTLQVESQNRSQSV